MSNIPLVICEEKSAVDSMAGREGEKSSAAGREGEKS